MTLAQALPVRFDILATIDESDDVIELDGHCVARWLLSKALDAERMLGEVSSADRLKASTTDAIWFIALRPRVPLLRRR